MPDAEWDATVARVERALAGFDASRASMPFLAEAARRGGDRVRKAVERLAAVCGHLIRDLSAAPGNRSIA